MQNTVVKTCFEVFRLSAIAADDLMYPSCNVVTVHILLWVVDYTVPNVCKQIMWSNSHKCLIGPHDMCVWSNTRQLRSSLQLLCWPSDIIWSSMLVCVTTDSAATWLSNSCHSKYSILGATKCGGMILLSIYIIKWKSPINTLCDYFDSYRRCGFLSALRI